MKRLALALIAGSCAAPSPMVGGGACRYEDFARPCEPIDAGLRDSGVWARQRVPGDGYPITMRVEIEAPAEQRDAILASVRAPLRCHGTRIVTAGSCNPYDAKIDAPALPDGARVVYAGPER